LSPEYQGLHDILKSILKFDVKERITLEELKVRKLILKLNFKHSLTFYKFRAIILLHVIKNFLYRMFAQVLLTY
jgi:hypothetical protein